MSEALDIIRRYAPNFFPKVGMILGSGLASLADQITNPITIPYQAIPGLHAGNVQGHASLLILGELNGTPVACFKGRLHLYEGTSYSNIQTLVRLIKQLGCHSVIITCAAGSLRTDVGPGDLMVLSDHINMHPGNPLVGPNDETIGPRFVSLENAYDSDMREIFADTARSLDIPYAEGVYLATLGPSFETPAEIRAYGVLGADAVGMSVVPEVILARHCGLRVFAVAAITNFAVGISAEKVTHEVTLQYAVGAARKLSKLIPAFLPGIRNVLG